MVQVAEWFVLLHLVDSFDSFNFIHGYGFARSPHTSASPMRHRSLGPRVLMLGQTVASPWQFESRPGRYSYGSKLTPANNFNLYTFYGDLLFGKRTDAKD